MENAILASRKCTSCGQSLSLNDKKQIFLHPLLKTIICKQCLCNYNDGDFSQFPNPFDEFGADNYCRWCADGGELLVCDFPNCHYAFCKECILRNFGKDYFDAIISKSTWICFACNPHDIKALVDFEIKNLPSFKNEQKSNFLMVNDKLDQNKGLKAREVNNNFYVSNGKNLDMSAKERHEVKNEYDYTKVVVVSGFVILSGLLAYALLSVGL
ncbi:transcriptional regulator ATRX-like protein [Dinothrombium tinctorium]|uniref:Transcriptional regulator ATRX-like protein n=1 Tax=Dinothrombium tinctorium TaxID=1965070 RepID=A0A3S3PDH5_9ACAR|nr:transcriptional regulator ATRX-like protein [Dinothrombium tinctorium]